MKLSMKKKDKKPSADGGEKKAKRKASRGSGDGAAKLKGFFAEHIEKLVLGLMALVALYFVYAGFAKEPLTTDPETVRTAINQAQNIIDSDTWASVRSERFPEPDNFDAQATQDSISIDASAYAIEKPFFARLQEKSQQRKDPELFAPVQIVVNAGYGAVQLKDSGGSGISELVRRQTEGLRPIPAEYGGNQQGSRSEISMRGNFDARYFVTVLGLVPYKKQFEEYEDVFKGAAEYEMDRDVPKYLGIQIERATQQADGNWGEWESLDTLSGMYSEPSKWSQIATERANEEYVLPRLVMALPPLFGKDIAQWAVHPQVPLAVTDVGRGEGVRRAEQTATEEQGTGGEPKSWLNVGPVGSSRGEGRGGPIRSEDRGGGGAVEGGAGDYNESAKPMIDQDFAMVRYFDFTVKPGQVYRYRVKAILEDPNNPQEGPMPSASACETDVLIRRQSATDPFRMTDWSEASSGVQVPTGHRVLAGTVVPMPRAKRVGPDGRIELTNEPELNVMALTFKPDGPYDVPVVVEGVKRGAVLNGTVEEAEAVDPTVGMVRALPSYNFRTGVIVADVDGGQNLGSDELTRPGMMLTVDENGQLSVHAEFGDIGVFERNVIPPDEELAAEATREEGGEEEGMREEENRFEEGGNGRNRGRRNNSR